jgi:outer membrane lipoprotein-sorting protein/peroxiredoxin
MSICTSRCLRSGRQSPVAALGTIGLLLLVAAGCTQTTQATSQKEKPLPPDTAGDVLERVIEAYHQADSYQDSGRLVIRYTVDGEVVSQTSEFSLALSGPNRMRMRALDALAVCDGQTFYATIDEAPGEVLNVAAPEELSPVAVYGHPVLGTALNQVVGSVPLSLFLDPNPLVGLLYNAQSPQLDTPEKIDADTYYRVRIDRRDGPLVLWVDQETFVVRRVDYPPDGYRRLMEPQVGEITDMTITAELEGAQLNPVIDDSTFRFEMPKGARLVKRFDVVRFGSRIPRFTLRTLDGQVLTRESLSDKIVIIKFWQTDDVLTYLDDLSGFEQVQKRYQEEDSIVFVAVSTDLTETPDDDLRAALERVNLALLVARTDAETLVRSFALESVPTTMILGRDGILQERTEGADPKEAVSLPAKLDTLLAGGDLYLEAPEEAHDYMFYSGLHWQNPPPPPDDDEPPAVGGSVATGEIASRTEPDFLQMKRVWSCSQRTPALRQAANERPETGPVAPKRPGNLLAIPGDSRSDRLFVLDGSLSVAEIDADGRMVARHRLELPYRDDTAVAFLRTATDAAGNRYILGSKAGVQQVHLFDAEWKRLLSFPEAGSHPGISDATLADLDGDGKLEMLVGYLAEVGIHCVTLDGERLWRNREAENQPWLAVTGPNRRGRRELLAAQGMILPIDAAGRQQSPIVLSEAYVRLIFTADLDGDKALEWCAITSPGPGKPPADVAVGFSPDGTEQWTYPLPQGVQQHASLEMVVSGNLLGDEVGQWIIAGADGSLHILDIDGNLIDRFNYGAAPSGMAVAKVKGRPALVIATDDSVDAWRFEADRKEP